jgi:hypothetical protein
MNLCPFFVQRYQIRSQEGFPIRWDGDEVLKGTREAPYADQVLLRLDGASRVGTAF